jgi:hypothetical protein
MEIFWAKISDRADTVRGSILGEFFFIPLWIFATTHEKGQSSGLGGYYGTMTLDAVVLYG